MKRAFILSIATVIAFAQTTPDKYSGKTVQNKKEGMELVQLRSKNAPTVGTKAPDFQLPTPNGKRRIRLSELVKRKPVVLVFGSST